MSRRWRQLLAAGGVFAAVIVLALVVLVVRTGSGPAAPATTGTPPTVRSSPVPSPGFPSGATLMPLHAVPLPGVCAGPAEPAEPITGTATANGGCPDAQGLRSGNPGK